MKISRLLSQPQQQRSREALEAILAAGQKLLRSEGLDGITMQKIAAEADVSVGNLYRIFGNKDALLLTVYEVFMTQGAERMAKTLSSIDVDQDTKTFLRLVIKVVARQYRTGATLTRDILNMGDKSGKLREVGTEYGRTQAKGFQDIILKHPRKIVQSNPVEAIEFCHRLLFNNFVMQAAYGSESPGVGAETWDSLEEKLSDVIYSHLYVTE